MLLASKQNINNSLNSSLSLSCEVNEALLSLNKLEKLLTQKVSIINKNGITTVTAVLYMGLGKIEIQTEGCGRGNIINRKQGY